jgi:hypothetical protein
MVDAGPRWADQMNSSNEAAKATPQTTTTFSASTLTWTPGETVLAIAGICDLPFQPQESNWSGIGYLIRCAESVKDVTFASTKPAGGALGIIRTRRGEGQNSLAGDTNVHLTVISQTLQTLRQSQDVERMGRLGWRRGE